MRPSRFLEVHPLRLPKGNLYYNAYESLLNAARHSFLGNKGFVNLFPSADTIFDPWFFFYNKLKSANFSKEAGSDQVYTHLDNAFSEYDANWRCKADFYNGRLLVAKEYLSGSKKLSNKIRPYLTSSIFFFFNAPDGVALRLISVGLDRVTAFRREFFIYKYQKWGGFVAFRVFGS